MRTVHEAIAEELCSLRAAPQSILDVGCANGSFTQALSAIFPHTAITGIDASMPKPFSVGRVTFLCGSVESLPFASESFDVAVAALSLHHWKNTERGVSEICRVLKKNGRLIIGDPLLEDWMRNRILGWAMQAIDGGSFTNENKIRAELSAAGFAQIKISLIPKTMRSLYLITADKQ